jgi:hypothetical protein
MLNGPASYSRLQKRPPYRSGNGPCKDEDVTNARDDLAAADACLTRKLLTKVQPRVRRVKLYYISLMCLLMLLMALSGAAATWYLFLRKPPLIWKVPNVCSYKQSLYSTRDTRTVPEGKYFFAANFHDNERVLPYLLNQLLLATSIFGYQNIFISIYESGSTDLSKEWLQHFGEAFFISNAGSQWSYSCPSGIEGPRRAPQYRADRVNSARE